MDIRVQHYRWKETYRDIVRISLSRSGFELWTKDEVVLALLLSKDEMLKIYDKGSRIEIAEEVPRVTRSISTLALIVIILGLCTMLAIEHAKYL